MADNGTKKVQRVGSNLTDGTLSIYSDPDADGKQHVATIFRPDPDKWPANILRQAAIAGFLSVAGNAFYRLDEPTSSDVQSAIERVHAAFCDGTWTPGRSFDTEPDDIVVALAEAMKVPVHVMQQDIDERLVRDERGEPVKDKRGRNKRVFTKAVLDAMAEDPAIKPIMARLAQERAARLAAEAKKLGKNAPTTGALDMFAHLRQTGTASLATAETDKAAE